MPERSGVTPKVAVITRTQNRPVLLERAIECVQTQTFNDFTHIIVNDGGDKANIDKVVDKKRESEDKLKVIHNNNQTGHAKALNTGIQSSDAKYVAVLDDDDSWDPEYLEKMVEHLDATGSKGAVITSDYVVEKVAKNKIETVKRARYRPDITEVSIYKQCVDNCAPTMAFVYRRDVYDELGGYDESLGVSEDWEFTLRFLLKYDIDFLNTEKTYAFYHYRPDAVGSIGNSVFAGAGRHKEQLNALANRFLRDDLQKGKLGLGFIINHLRYQREREEATIIPAAEEISRVVEDIKQVHRQVYEQVYETEKRLTRLVLNRTSVKNKINMLLRSPKRLFHKK